MAGARARHDKVHPHGCGERALAFALLAADAGSSPRVWGTLIGFPLVNAWSRFIPTGVGNASGDTVTQTAYTVHPHGCGERLAISA